MRGFHKGTWYAEVFRSTRFVGTTTISVHEFETEKERDSFINEYNQILLEHQGVTPETYTMAQEPHIYTIHEHITSKQ